MGLSGQAFWSLTMHEFWIKHRAFMRAEHRVQALVRELALLTTPSSKSSDNKRRERDVHTLRRYPMKKWLDQPPS